MDRKSVHKGLFGSIGLHLVIMLIPLSTTVDWKLEEIELYVLDERPVIKKDVIERPKKPTVLKAPEEEVRKEPVLPPMPPIAEEEIPENQQVIEPEKELIEEPQVHEPQIEAPQIQESQIQEPPIQEPLIQDPLIQEPKEEAPEITEPPVAIEPPVTFPEPIPEAPAKSQSPPSSQPVVPLVLTQTVEKTEPTTAPPKTLEAPTESQTGALKQSPTTLEDVPFGSDVAPRFLHREMPIYPLLARRLGKEGKVLLRLTIDEKGNLLGVDVIEKGGYGFTEAAMEAVKKSTFLPARKDGKPIASRALLTVRFRLERN